MKNQDNHYLNNIPKYESGSYSRYNNSTKYSNNNSKYRDYYYSTEDEKTNSKSNNFLSDKNKTTNNKYKQSSKLTTNYYPFTTSQKLFNDNEYQVKLKKNYKNIIQDNSSHLSNHKLIKINSMIDGKNLNKTIPNNFRNSLKIESDKKKNNNSNQNFIKNKSHHALNINDNYNIQQNIYNKNKDKNIIKHVVDLSDKFIEYDSNTYKSYRAGNINNINNNFYNTINKEKENYSSKANTSQRKNPEYVTKVNNKNESNLLYNINNKIHVRTTKERRENNLSLNIKTSNNIQNILNKNKKNVIMTIPNNKNSDKINKNLTLHKKPELTKLKKLSFMTLSNLSNLNDFSKKNISDKNNHSFFEVKSLSRDFVHQQTEVLTSESKKLSMKIKNNNSILNLSSNKNHESNLKQNNNISNTINNENLSKTKNNLFKLEEKKEVKDKKFNLTEFDKYFIKGRQNYILSKENKKNNSEIINKDKTNPENIYKRNDKIIFNRDKIKIGNIQIKKQEKNNNFIKIKNGYKIKEISNKKRNSHIESIIRRYKYNLNKINSYSFNYMPKIREEKIKNKKFNSNKKLLALKNLNSKTFEEDFPLKIKSYKRYKINKILKPQISVRMTLFNIAKPERERYYFVNFFYSENIRNPILVESDF